MNIQDLRNDSISIEVVLVPLTNSEKKSKIFRVQVATELAPEQYVASQVDLTRYRVAYLLDHTGQFMLAARTPHLSEQLAQYEQR
jgi:hypothetical protein